MDSHTNIHQTSFGQRDLIDYRAGILRSPEYGSPLIALIVMQQHSVLNTVEIASGTQPNPTQPPPTPHQTTNKTNTKPPNNKQPNPHQNIPKKSRHPQTMRRCVHAESQLENRHWFFQIGGAFCRIDAKDASVWCVPAASVSIPPCRTG